MPNDPRLSAMPDPMALVLGAWGFCAVLMVLRFVAAVMLPSDHRLSRAAEAIDAPLWAVGPGKQDIRYPDPGVGGNDGGTPPCT